MLQEFVYPQLNELPDIIFQLDGAPPHWGLDVRASLNEQFPGRWIGRDGPTPWPPRSPDLKPLDFFLWGCIKQVYKTPVNNIKTPRARIRRAVASITRVMLTNSADKLLVFFCSLSAFFSEIPFLPLSVLHYTKSFDHNNSDKK